MKFVYGESWGTNFTLNLVPESNDMQENYGDSTGYGRSSDGTVSIIGMANQKDLINITFRDIGSTDFSNLQTMYNFITDEATINRKIRWYKNESLEPATYIEGYWFGLFSFTINKYGRYTVPVVIREA